MPWNREVYALDIAAGTDPEEIAQYIQQRVTAGHYPWRRRGLTLPPIPQASKSLTATLRPVCETGGFVAVSTVSGMAIAIVDAAEAARLGISTRERAGDQSRRLLGTCAPPRQPPGAPC